MDVFVDALFSVWFSDNVCVAEWFRIGPRHPLRSFDGFRLTVDKISLFLVEYGF